MSENGPCSPESDLVGKATGALLKIVKRENGVSQCFWSMRFAPSPSALQLVLQTHRFLLFSSNPAQ